MTPKTPIRRSRSFLYWLCAFITVMISFEMFVEFGSNGEGFGKENDLPWIYLTLLAAYAADKEIGHWSSRLPEDQIKKRKGEWFIVWWVLYTVIMLFLIQATNLNFIKPHNLIFVFKGVLAIFLGGAASKYLRMQAIPQDAVPEDASADNMPPADQTNDDDVPVDTTPLDPLQTSTLGQAILTLLQNHPEGLTSGQIAAQLGVSRSLAQRALPKLTASGQVVKVALGPRDPHTRYKSVS